MNPGDVVIGDMTVGGFDVRPWISEFSVYESMHKPYSIVTASIVDSAGMINKLLDQPVDMSLSFGQPGQRPWEGNFAITSIEKAKSSQNLRVARYELTGYSRHMTRFPRVQKAYRETTATDTVSDLVNSFLNPDRPLEIRDPSRGVLGNQHMPFNINGVQIHKAIRGVLERAVSSSNDSSAYVIFETNRSLVVDTLEHALDQALSSPVVTYYQRPMGVDWLRDQVLQNFTIISAREDSRNDRTETVQSENQEINPIDMFSGNIEKSYVGARGLVSSIVNLVHDSMRPPTHLAQAIPERRRIAADFDSQSLTIHVPLNVELTVGDGFKVDLLSPLGDTSVAEPSSISGEHLAIEIRHRVLGDQQMKGTSTIKGTRGGR